MAAQMSLTQPDETGKKNNGQKLINVDQQSIKQRLRIHLLM